MSSILPYDRTRHDAAVYELWLRTFGEKWAIERPTFKRTFTAPAWVALVDERIVGFVGTRPEGVLAAIFVDEAHRRGGIASALFATAVEHLRNAGNARVVIGGTPFLWKGIPLEQSAALEFFRSRGCVLTERMFDQYRFLEGYEHPSALFDELRDKNLHVRVSTVSDAESILAFEQAHFPHWRDAFEQALRWARYDDVICAMAGEQLVGTALVSGPGPMFPGAQWSLLKNKQFGTYATLGVAQSHRGLRLGIALSAFATECVRERRGAGCFINQSDAVGLYEKLGFALWSEYQCAEYRWDQQ